MSDIILRIPSFKITSAMFVESVLDLLESLAQHKVTSTQFFQLVELTLVGSNEEYIADDWLDVVKIMTNSQLDGFQLVKEILDGRCPNASGRCSQLSNFHDY